MPATRAARDKDFTVMSIHHLRHTRLSLKAIGLFSIILSLPPEWKFSVAGLAAITKDGISSVRGARSHPTGGNPATGCCRRYDLNFIFHSSPPFPQKTTDFSMVSAQPMTAEQNRERNGTSSRCRLPARSA